MARSLSVKSLAIAALVLALLCGTYGWERTRHFISDLDLLGLSARYQLRGPEAPDPLIRLVGITENTIDAFAKTQVYYPFPRDIQALALRRLADAGARLVVVDILFSEADSFSSEEDIALRDAIEYCRAQGCEVVLAAAIENIDYAKGVSSRSLVTPAPLIMEAKPSLGLANTQPKLSFKSDELVRLSLPLGPQGQPQSYYSQATEAFRLACAQTERSFDSELDDVLASAATSVEEFPINYNGPPSSFQGYVYAFDNLFRGLIDGQPLRKLSTQERRELTQAFLGSYVFLGSRAMADNDYFQTPFGQMFGVDTNAQAFDTLLSRRNVHSVPPATVLGLTVLLGILAWSLSLHRPILKSAAGALVVYLLLAAINVALLVTARVDLSLTMSTQGFALPYIACMIFGGVTEELAKRRIRSTFSRYVSTEIVEQIVANPRTAALGGMERNVAVLFNDICDYSTLTEQLTPAQVVAALNLYLSEVSEVIRRNRGFVDKFLGDGMMAVFGGPAPTADPAGDAILSAVEITRALHERINPRLSAQGLPQFKAGVGVHFGPVVMGNIGSEARMDYTVVGGAVNVASRVEELTREFGWAVLVTREVRDAARQAGSGIADRFDFQIVGEQLVKGRQLPVEIYRVTDPAAPTLFTI